MVIACKVQRSMQQQDTDLVTQAVAVFGCLSRSGIERNGKVAGAGLGGAVPLRGREGEHVSRLVLAAVGAVQAAKGGVVGKKDVDLALHTHGGADKSQKAREAAL